MKWVSERGMARTISHPWRSHHRGIRDAFPKLQWGILALTFCTCLRAHNLHFPTNPLKTHVDVS